MRSHNLLSKRDHGSSHTPPDPCAAQTQPFKKTQVTFQCVWCHNATVAKHKYSPAIIKPVLDEWWGTIMRHLRSRTVCHVDTTPADDSYTPARPWTWSAVSSSLLPEIRSTHYEHQNNSSNHDSHRDKQRDTPFKWTALQQFMILILKMNHENYENVDQITILTSLCQKKRE